MFDSKAYSQKSIFQSKFTKSTHTWYVMHMQRRQDCIMEEQRLQLVCKPMSSRSMLSSVRSPTSLLSLSVRVMKDNQFVNSRLSSRGRAIGEKGISRSYCYSENNKICAEMKLCKISEKACKSISTR